MTVPSNENVTERRGGQGGPARERDRLDPLAVHRCSGYSQLLSVVRPPSRSGLLLSPRGRPSLHRSHRATAGDWSAHRARCLLRSALEYPGAARPSTAAPACRFSALHGGYRSSDRERFRERVFPVTFSFQNRTRWALKNSDPLSGCSSLTPKGSRSSTCLKAASIARWPRPKSITRSLNPVATSISCKVCPYSPAALSPP